MKTFFVLSFVMAAAPLVTAQPMPSGTPVNYTDRADGDFLLQGFLSLPDVTPAPAVIILPDWDGNNFYESQRASMIAQDLGYVGFAADIYGIDNLEVEDIEKRRELAGMYRGNSTLFVSRINAAVETVKSLDTVDADNVAIIGYCFGGTGVLTYGLLGEDGAVALVSFHGGLSIPEAGPEVIPKLLVLSGGEDDTATEVYDLETTLNLANATWEITRYSGIEHAFTVFSDDRYNEWADMRSWESMIGFLAEAFGEVPFDGMMPESADVTPVDYTDVDGTELRGYLSLPGGNSSSPMPAVILYPDWDGVNEYEQLRATMLADSGYVGFAADIFGADLQEDLSFEQRVNLTTLYRSNETLFVQRMQRAIDVVKEFPEVDVNKIFIGGYCFGGTAIIEYAFTGRDVLAAVSFHGGLQDLPNNTVDIKPYVLVLSGGIDDQHGNQTVLEMSLDDAMADWEVTRYSEVGHGFTAWDSPNYNVRADARSWESMMTLFEEILAANGTTGDMDGGASAASAARAFVAVVLAFVLSVFSLV